jgi:hypothetical protein
MSYKKESREGRKKDIASPDYQAGQHKQPSLIYDQMAESGGTETERKRSTSGVKLLSWQQILRRLFFQFQYSISPWRRRVFLSYDANK